MKKLLVLLVVALTLVGCGSKGSGDKESKEIVIGGTSLPHADFLKQLEAPLKEQGYTLKIVVYDDYVLPNQALESKTLDANYFQHTPYLLDFNEKHNTDLVPILKVHYEPIAIYAGARAALTDVQPGDKVLVPDDATNLPRALKLLEELGWIVLNDNRDNVTLKDVVANNKDIEIVLAAADKIAPQLSSSAFSVINGNYALAAGVTDKGIQAETIDAEKIEDIVNIVAIRRGDEETEKTKAILAAFNDPAVKEYIATKFAPAAISVLGN